MQMINKDKEKLGDTLHHRDAMRKKEHVYKDAIREKERVSMAQNANMISS